MRLDLPTYPTTRDSHRATRHWRETESRERLTADIAFNRHSMQDGSHVSPFDNGVVAVGTDRIQVGLVQGIPDSFIDVLAKATKATIGIEPSEDEPPSREDAEEMLRGGLQTALEDAVVVFEVRGVSRTCTHQLVRTRKAAFHQQSQRASYAGDYPEVRMPESVWNNRRAREAFLRAVEEAHSAYQIAAEEDISYQDARFILPEGTTSYILCEYPLRTFLDTYAYRACSMFQWEIVKVFRLMRECLVDAHPWLDPYIKISCERTSGALDVSEEDVWSEREAAHACTFQGWESVEEQCSFPWARDTNRTYQPRQDLRIVKKGD